MELVATVLAVMAALMLAICVGLWIRPFASFWGRTRERRREPLQPLEPLSARRNTWVKIALAMLLTRIAIYLLGYWLRGAAFGGGGTLFRSMEAIWSRTDAPHYLDLARDGYQPFGEDAVFLVFLPLYPWALRAVMALVGDAFAAGMIVSNVAAVLSAVLLYELCLLDMDKGAAQRSVKFAFLMPAAFFYSAPLSESLFLVFAIACVLGIRKKHWLIGCICGGLAALTRSLGVLLAVVALTELGHEIAYGEGFRNARTWRRMLCVLLIPAGTAAYLALNYVISGNPLQFLVYQREHWSQQFGSFYESIRGIAHMMLVDAAESPDMSFALWMPQLIAIFSALLLMLAMARRMRPSYTAFCIVYFVVAIAPTWLLSAPRYLLVLFPLAMALGELTQNRVVNLALTGAMGAGFLAYMTAYLGGLPIF